MKATKRILLVLLFCGVFINPGFTQMLSEISSPVETEFGRYLPYPVSITPAADFYQVSPDLGEVKNIADFQFTESEKQMLFQHHFFVTARRSGKLTGYKEIYDIYNECREMGIPIFVTTDAMLHTFHLIFDRMLMEVEQKQFFGDLNNLLTALLDVTMYEQYPALNDSLTRISLMKTIDYLIVAKTLLDSTYVPPINGGAFIEELAKIRAHQGFEISPIFGYVEDYSQYIVRGHYTRTDSLRHYFLSMMWLGRMTFAADPAPCFDALSREGTLAALLLLQAMERVTINGESSMDIWDRIYSPTVFFVGKSDDVNFRQYRPLVQQIYGNSFASMDVNAIRKGPEFDNFLQQAKALPGPKIHYPGQPQGFRFMGQRFIPDSYILDQVVFDNVPGRFMPKGLDVMTVLGSQQAYKHLEAQGEMRNLGYKNKIDSLCSEFKNYSPETWAQNLYWNWLYSLMPLLFPKGEGFPPFMQNTAWYDKELYAALSSWAELRHDTILYAKQSGTEWGMPPNSILKQGFVEPNPWFFGRIAALARFLKTGLANRDLLYPKFELHLTNFETLSLSLKQIAEKELLNQALTYDDYLLINEFGLKIEIIAEFNEWSETSGPSPDSEDEMPVIADVHTDINSLTCLEEGVGYPLTIYVITNIEGQLKITKGAAFSYYEFTQPISRRMTDESWRELLKTGPVPAPPDWSASFLQADWSNPKPDFYMFEKCGVTGLQIDLAADTLMVGELVQAIISPVRGLISAPPTVWLETPAGERTQITQVEVLENAYKTNVPTTGFSPGRYFLETSGTITDNIEYQAFYRTSFWLTSVVDVPDYSISRQTTHFELHSNFPNPFNATTQIAYHVAKPGNVTLTIFDSMGREVCELLNCSHSAGGYQVKWDGRDSQGNLVAAGVYFYRMQAGDFQMVRKLVLLY